MLYKWRTLYKYTYINNVAINAILDEDKIIISIFPR